MRILITGKTGQLGKSIQQSVIDDIDQAEDTMTILSKYVNSMKIDNKQELDTLMKSLYTEALTMETI